MIETGLLRARVLAQQLLTVYVHYDHALQVAWWMLESVTCKTMADMFYQPLVLTSEQESTLQWWVYQHTQEHMPLQYLIGSVPFLDSTIMVRPPILIPRPETEQWVSALINEFNNRSCAPTRILDIGTGTGCIGLALARAFSQAHVLAIDISQAAIDLAQENAQINGIDNCDFRISNLFAELDPLQPFDLIVANPPYVRFEAWQQLEPRVRIWEDSQALWAAEDGLSIIRKILYTAAQYITPYCEYICHTMPQLVIEIGYDQGALVREIAQEAGFSDIAIVQDYQGHDRLLKVYST